MKKEYITPRTAIVMMETAELMAASDGIMSVSIDSSSSTDVDESKQNTFELWED